MFVIKTDAQGNAVMGTDGKPIMIELPDGIEKKLNGKSKVKLLTAEEADQQRRSHVTRVEQQLNEATSARDQLATQLASRESAVQADRRAQLPPEQQVTEALNDITRRLEASEAARRADAQVSKESIRRIGLVAYRERALQDVPSAVHHMVIGDNEEAIDAACDHAREVYEDMLERMRAEIGQPAPQPQFVQPGVQQHQPPQYAQPYQPQIAPPVQYAPQYPPPNPAYVPPPAPQLMQQGGFPTATNPPQMPLPESAEGQIDLSELTTEEAVRSGRYSGEMRARVLGAIKGNAKYPGSLGTTPRYAAAQMAPQGYVQQPMGVMQPQGIPTPQATPPGHPQYQQAPQYQAPPQQPQYASPPQGYPQYAQPQYPQQPPPQYVPQYAPPQQYQQAPGPRGMTPAKQAAKAAIARTNAGQNPAVHQNVGAPEQLADVHQYARRNGIDPNSAQQQFDQRFAPSQPINPGQ